MRPARVIRSMVSVAVLAAGSQSIAAEGARHNLVIDLDPVTHRLTVRDRIELGSETASEHVDFLLNAALTIEDSSPPVERLEEVDRGSFFSLNAGPPNGELELAAYRITAPPADGHLTLSYAGTFDFGLSAQKEEYTRGFRETAGIVGGDGVYLAGSGFWYPVFGDQLVEFDLEVAVPEGWHLVSSGSGSARGADGVARWSSDGQVDEIYLVGGPSELYREAAGAVEAQVYLRQPDDALAAKYLEATGRYIEMYRGLLGPYPYDKFALVENFWETGYGMPSFTLLGPTVIRFPFILTSSYPHEILHNWWGNSVFVDFAGGNWSEGLTAYLADHLLQEQRGKGDEYRRAALQKYRSYVQSGEDFPLTAFRSRHSAATEAVGYGKTMMVFHMLRRELGDEAFVRALASFYRRHRGTRASFADLERVFEEAGGTSLDIFFADWVGRAGAPHLALEVRRVAQTSDQEFVIAGRLEQRQQAPAYELTVPAVVETGGGPIEVTIPVADGSGGDFEIRVGEPPLALRIDPRFDLFRLLDAREIPPSIGQVFGEPAILAVLPSNAPPAERDRYRDLVTGWQSDSHVIEIVEDGDLESLPTDRSAWVLGRDNAYAGLFTDPDRGVVAAGTDLAEVNGEAVPWAAHSLVVVRRHPEAEERAVGWLVADPAAAFPGLGRKLPHYGKYSYLGFEGAEPTNMVKGQWSAEGSPLVADLRPGSERAAPLVLSPLSTRAALAELPPVFAQSRLAEHVRFLADPGLEGRAPGSEGIRRAASYVAAALEEAGLEPAGDDGYFQELTIDSGPRGGAATTVNVLGALRGSRPEWADQMIVLSAHYDHLGRGWPDVHAGDEGIVHPGADDNASGVAVLIELARALAAGETPARTIVFAAFSAEEAGRAGSIEFLSRLTDEERRGIRAVVNLDTVGRLFDGAVSVLGAGTATEWPHIFRGASYVTGVDSKIATGAAEASDQMSFIARGIPGVQLFSGAHGDYHRPGDTSDKIDAAGLVKVATLAKEAVVYLAGREEPLSATIDEAKGGAAPAESAPSPSSGRRVRIGTVPDFAFPGPGVRIESVAPGSPGERAGLAAGDVILAIDGRDVDDLAAYAALLRRLEPGQAVEVRVERSGETLALEVMVEAR